MARNTEDITSAGLVRSVLRWTPHMNFTKIEPEELPPSQWDAAVQEKRSTGSWLKEIKHFPAQSGRNLAETQIIMMSKS